MVGRGRGGRGGQKGSCSYLFLLFFSSIFIHRKAPVHTKDRRFGIPSSFTQMISGGEFWMDDIRFGNYYPRSSLNICCLEPESLVEAHASSWSSKTSEFAFKKCYHYYKLETNILE